MFEDPKLKHIKLPKNFKQNEEVKKAPEPHKKRQIKMAAPKKPTLNSSLSQLMDIYAAEIARLQVMSGQGALSVNDTKRLQMLMESFTKLAKEAREVRKQSVLEGKSDEEIADLVKEAMLTLEIDDDEE